MLRMLFGTIIAFGAASPALAQVAIKNIQARHGQFGPERASLDLYPGDEVVFTYTIEGVKTDPAGTVACDFELKVSDESGKVVFQQTSPATQTLPIGGHSFPNASHFGFGIGTPPGKYKVTVICTDKRQQLSDSFERVVTCLKPAFAVVQPRFSYDAKGETSASLINVYGQTIFVRFSVVEFDRSHKKIDLSMSMQLIDEKGAELLPKPVTNSLVVNDPKQIENAQFASFAAAFSCLQLGTFKVSITVTDNVANKAIAFEAPFRVIANEIKR
jgi:hypothetical protein